MTAQVHKLRNTLRGERYSSIRSRSPGAKRRMFILTETARLEYRIRSVMIPNRRENSLSYLNRTQPHIHLFLRKKRSDIWNRVTATGSLNSLSKNMEWIRYEVRNIKTNAYGGTKRIVSLIASTSTEFTR